MASIDLNIIDRGTPGSKWLAEDTSLGPESLDKVLEQKTDNSGALNSLPTPFARFFVAKEAFRRVMEEHLNPKNEAGFAYSQLVSDILDVYELLYNLKYHQNTWTNGQTLEIREWDADENLKRMQRLTPVLYNSINEFYTTDINQDKLYFLVFTENGQEKLLACSSPLTGFITPPDMDKSIDHAEGTPKTKFAGERYSDLHIHRKSGGEYFRDIKKFEDREPDFKNYMYNVLFGSEGVDEKFRPIKEFVQSFKDDRDINMHYNPSLMDVKTEHNDSLTINGLVIKATDELDVNNLFTPTLIKVPYRISRDNFNAVIYQNDTPNRDYDYLLPLKTEALPLFKEGKMQSEIHLNRNSVTVTLMYGGKKYSKEYDPEPLAKSHGKIWDLHPDKINFDLGIFPNILSERPSENNYFKVMVVGADEDPAAPYFNIDELSLKFFKEGEEIKEVDSHEPGANFGVEHPVVRSRQKSDDKEAGTKFYEIYNTSFDAIEINILGHTGILFPKWKESHATDDHFTYAIDLGTSNTFISRCKAGENNRPEMFSMDMPVVNYMHEMPNDRQKTVASRIENSIFKLAQERIKTEFVPAIIDGLDYKFPIRTAICGLTRRLTEEKLFDSHNIAFFYEKFMTNEDQRVTTDIKWSREENLLRIFIRELLLLVKCDILQRNGDLKQTKIIWFSPLSFMGNIREMYSRVWREECARILFISGMDHVRRYSESEVPYYFFKKDNIIPDSSSVAVMDIGGGSTDFVYFRDNNPLFANSIHFGCDVLWENGFSGFDNTRENGIYQKYKDTLRFKRGDLKDLHEAFKLDKYAKTKDIINFWLSNSDMCDIQKLLAQDFKPVFVYHFASLLFYMASMYKEQKLYAPKTIVLSGNGSRYIDNFISSDAGVLQKIINYIFTKVYGEKQNIFLSLPNERKEATCYGGLYRKTEPEPQEVVYHGDKSASYKTISDVNSKFDKLQESLSEKYKNFNTLYKEVLDLLRAERILDSSINTKKYVENASADMIVPLKTYYQSQIKERYQEDDFLYESIFFLPIINRVFELTKLNNNE